MLREKTGIGPGLLFTITVSLLLGISSIQITNVAAEYGGHNGYWGLIGAYLLSLLVIYAASDLQKMYPEKSLVEYASIIFGKVPGKVFGFIFLLLIFFLLLWSVRATAEVINLYFLQRTPLSIVAGLFILSAGYLASKGVEGITKTCAFFLPLALIIIVFSILVSYELFNYDRIRPVFYLDQRSMLSSVVQLFYVFFPLANLFIFLPYLTEKGTAFTVVVKATIISVAILFVAIAAVTGTYGAKGVARYSWPMIEMTRTESIPYLLQSFGGLYFVAWISQVYIGAGACYFAAAKGCSQLFPCLHYKWFILILFPVIVFLSLFLPGVIEARTFFDYFRIVGAVILFFIPLLLWVTAKLKNGRSETNAA